MVERVYEYLNRYGFINFGVYTSPNTPEPAPTAPKVLVVGAGISGSYFMLYLDECVLTTLLRVKIVSVECNVPLTYFNSF